MVDWKQADAKVRLMAALIASLGNQKLNYREIARLYGNDATYDAIENQFRTARKEAAKLLEEAESGNRQAPPVRKRSNAAPKARHSSSAAAPKNRGAKPAAAAPPATSGRGQIMVPKKNTAAKTTGDATTTTTATGAVGVVGLAPALNQTLGGRVSKSKSVSPANAKTLFGENAYGTLGEGQVWTAQPDHHPHHQQHQDHQQENDEFGMGYVGEPVDDVLASFQLDYGDLNQYSFDGFEDGPAY